MIYQRSIMYKTLYWRLSGNKEKPLTSRSLKSSRERQTDSFLEYKALWKVPKLQNQMQGMNDSSQWMLVFRKEMALDEYKDD